MTIQDILAKTTIHADRYAMAAISYIYNAFGEITLSKECWPWGRDLQFEWQHINDANLAITYAQLMLEKAKNINNDLSNNEDDTQDNINISNELSNQLNILQKNIKKIFENINDINKSNEYINEVSHNVSNKISNISNE